MSTPSFKFIGRVQDLKLLQEMIQTYPEKETRIKGSFGENIDSLKKRINEKLTKLEGRKVV